MLNTYIDDTDSQVQYSANWQTSRVAADYNGTTHQTVVDGATATLVFTGTGIGVYGTIGPSTYGGPRTLYTVDGSGQVMYSPAAAPEVTQYRQQLFSNQSLQNGKHTIVITISQSNSPFFLDYFVVSSPSSLPSPDTVSSKPAPTSTSTPSTTTAISTLLGAITPTVSQTTTNINSATANANSTTSNTNSSTSKTVVFEALLGCFILISLVMSILWLRLYLRHKSTSFVWTQGPLVTPFMRRADDTIVRHTLQSTSSFTGTRDGIISNDSMMQRYLGSRDW